MDTNGFEFTINVQTQFVVYDSADYTRIWTTITKPYYIAFVYHKIMEVPVKTN